MGESGKMGKLGKLGGIDRLGGMGRLGCLKMPNLPILPNKNRYASPIDFLMASILASRLALVSSKRSLALRHSFTPK